MVSARSVAMSRMRPAGMSRTARIEAGVSNVCIVVSGAGSFLMTMKRYVAFMDAQLNCRLTAAETQLEPT